LVKYYRRFRNQLCSHHQSLMVGTEMIPETFLICNQLTWLTAREDYITLSRRESFRSYIKITIMSEILSFGNFLEAIPLPCCVLYKFYVKYKCNILSSVQYRTRQKRFAT
jgi:hypothetical protein